MTFIYFNESAEGDDADFFHINLEQNYSSRIVQYNLTKNK